MFRCFPFALVSFVALFVRVLPAQGEATPVPTPPPAAVAVEVPTFPNPTCPIMGKRVSMPLFVDTEAGRFYVCCKPCIKKIQANVPAAQQTAYPTTKVLANKVCPVSGEPIGAEAVTVTLQGHSFQVCCTGCVETARADAQIVLTKLLVPGVIDIGNATCPVTGEATARNAFVLVGTSLVRLSSPKAADAVVKDPTALLQKAIALQKQQPAPAPHVHTKQAVPAVPEQDAKPQPKEGGK